MFFFLIPQSTINAFFCFFIFSQSLPPCKPPPRHPLIQHYHPPSPLHRSPSPHRPPIVHDDDEPIRKDHIHHEYNHDHPQHNDNDHGDDLPLPSETYVVQVPKDQIYRVPPPENALLAELYQNPARARKNRRAGNFCCCNWVTCLILAVLIVGIVVVASVSHLFLVAKDPIFRVESFIAKNVSGGKEFDVGLKAENPNTYSDVLYKQGGRSSLSFKQKKIASGGFPTFHQDKKNTADVKITLRDSGGTFPTEIKVWLSSEKAGSHLSFTQKVTVTARMKKGFFQRHDVNLSVSCSYTIDKLAAGTRILSEECQTKHS